MYRIGIMETRAVHHGLLDMCKVSNIGNVKVTVFTIKKIYDQAQEVLGDIKSQFEWVIKGETESYFKFLKRAEKICNSRIDLLNLRSVKIPSYWFFWPKCKILLATFDGIFFLMPCRLLINSLKSIFEVRPFNIAGIKKALLHIYYTLSYVLIAPKAWIFVRQSTAIYTIGSASRKWLMENTSCKKRFYHLPHVSFEGSYLPASDRVTFVIAGMIQEIRRDYLMALRVFERLFSKFSERIELSLLGKPVGEYGWNMISYCESLQRRGWRINFYKEYVPPKIYKETYLKADLIINPLIFSNKKGSKKEIYSVTMPSGVTQQDTIRYAKPVIVPSQYNVQEEFKTSFLKYKDERDLENILEELILDRNKLEQLKKEALNNSKLNFSLEKIQAKFSKIVEECLAA